MKTVVIGDIHGRSVWKLIVEIEKPDRVIFIGDYFDSFDIKGVDQLSNFQDIIAFKESGQCEVIMLIGNHDYHYFPEIGNTGTSGYQHIFAPSIQYVVGDNRKHLQMAYQMDEYLFTHAGVSSKFLDNVFMDYGWKTENIATDLNELFKYKPKQFEFGMAVNIRKMSYLDPSGDNEEQSPIWIRPRSLFKVNHDTLRKQVIQIFGHTQIEKIDTKGLSTGERYYLIDCLGTSGQYMIIDDLYMNEVTFNTWKSKNA
jgi:predicted MPP superfamily phosphohydrolase